MKYKMICSDLDDTLLNGELEITERTKRAVRRYVDKGGKFSIVTGRMTAAALPYCAELNLTGELLSFQGAVVSDISTGKILDEVKIPADEAYKIGRYLEEKNIYYQTYAGNIFMTRKATEYTKRYGGICRAEYFETGIPLSEYIRENRLAVPKIVIMGDETAIPAIERDLKERLGAFYMINSSKSFLVEIAGKETNKGEGVRKLAKKYDIPLSDVICVGDSENDVPMIEAAGLGAAVKNSPSFVQKAADIVVPGCDEDGVAFLIEEYGLKD